MAHSNSWDETNPTNTTLATSIDDEIRKLRLDIRERLANDHKFAASDDAGDAWGIHKKVTIEDQIASPTLTSNQKCLYAQTDDNECELRYKDKRGIDSLISFIGEVRMRMGTTVPAGWLALNGDSIGDADSGATHTGTNYQNLYYWLWNELDNTAAPVAGGRGASAAADWASHKKLTMPDARSRLPICTGQGSGLTNRIIGRVGGAETYSISHVHGMSSHTHNLDYGVSGSYAEGSANPVGKQGAYHSLTTTGSGAYLLKQLTAGPNTANTESGGTATQNVMNPWIVISMLIRY